MTAALAAIFFNFPSKKLIVIGVTGTDGKTTTVHMIADILKNNDQKVSMISSIAAKIGKNNYDTGFHVTTPSAWQTQRFMRRAADAGHKYFVMEATSHGLHQNRLANTKIKIGVLTNITNEHMDYHKTWQNYADAKFKLLEKAETAVLNLDDEKSYSYLAPKLKNKVVTYSHSKEADINLVNFPLKLNVPGAHNVSNALAAASVGVSLGISATAIKKALKNFQMPVGRMDEIKLGQNYRMIVDFAHTPNALEKALQTLQDQKSTNGSRVIAVFGAAGDRDKLKRPQMGRVADELADIVVLTAEDPRREKVQKITAQIASTIKNKTYNETLFAIEDRTAAIDFAAKLARPGDIVALFGKGHEKSMCYGRKEYPWDELKAAKTAIRNNKKK